MPDNARSLRARWSREMLQKVNEAFYRGSLTGLSLPKLTIEGVEYLDLRGITLHRQVRDARFERLDLSYCTAGDGIGQFLDVTLADCRMTSADCELIIIDITATRCHFDRARLHQFGGQFTDCTFRCAKMGEYQAGQSRYIRCDFSGADWRKTHAFNHMYENCIWTDCRFGGGSFAGSRFVGMRPDSGALGDTIMDDVDFE